MRERGVRSAARPAAAEPEPACTTSGVTCLNYGADGRLESVVDPANRITLYDHDAEGNLIKIVEVDDSLRRYFYDQNQRMIAEASQRGFVTEHDYGAAGQWIGTDLPDGASISATISDSLGLADFGTTENPQPYAVPDGEATLQDGRRNIWKMKFSAFGTPIEITDPIDRTTVIDRNAGDLVEQVTRPNDGELPDGTVPTTVPPPARIRGWKSVAGAV